jgi:RNA polymerase sigma factor (sigma-70 family)
MSAGTLQRPTPTGAALSRDRTMADKVGVPDLAGVYEAHFRYVWRCLRSLGVRDAQLDDALQDVFLVVQRRLPEFDGGAELRTWLYAIALRIARKYRERAQREPASLEAARERTPELPLPPETSGEGTCLAVPSGACDAVYQPVCGCDGKTYSNDCTASLAGVSVMAVGVCPGDGVCGGFTGKACDKGFFCDYPPEQICGNADGQGKCQPIPSACTKEIAEVCGCDGKTYSNACLANAAGTSVLQTGKCPAK